MARSSCSGVVMCCVLPVLWMTSYLHTSQLKVARRRRPAEAQLTRSLGLGYKRRVGIPVAGNGRTGLLLADGLGSSTGGRSLRFMTALFDRRVQVNERNKSSLKTLQLCRCNGRITRMMG